MPGLRGGEHGGAVHHPGPALLDALARAQRLGVLGPAPLDDHLDHSRHFLRALEGVEGTVLDLGSGGGLPGLVIADARPDLRLVLLDAQERRVALLREAVDAMGCGARVIVLRGRAEDLGRSPEMRGHLDVVTARLFGAPGTTAECGAPFLRVGGVLLVSEPPGPVLRWPAEGLHELGLVHDARSTAHLTALRAEAPCPDRFPRRVGIPAKRPLF